MLFLVSPDSALSESLKVRKQKDSDCEDGDHAQYPSQESSTGSSLLVGPQSSPLMHRAHPENVASRSEIPRENVRQAVPAVIAINETNSTEKSGDSPLSCTSPNGAVTVQHITVQMQQATNCPFSFTGQSFGTDGQQGKQSQVVVETDGQVAEFSCEFGAVVHDIIDAVNEEKKEKRLLHMATWMTHPDPNDPIFPGATRATSTEEFFQMGREKNWWHWLDFDRLLLILEKSKCTQALEVIKPYMKKLGDHVKDRLSVLKEDPPRDKGHWLHMKCQCDTASLRLEHIKNHKKFLISRLKVPNLAFTYCDTYDGCMLTVWKIHSPMQAADVKKKLLAIEGCSKMVEPGREMFKATLYTPFPGKTIFSACL